MIIGNKTCEEIECEDCPLYGFECGAMLLNTLFETWKELKEDCPNLELFDELVMNELNKEEGMTSKEKNLYKIGDILVLKENLILVKIVKARRKEYGVIYPHLNEPQEFWVKENELEEKPYNYEQKVFEAYIEYRVKYKELIERLYSPKFRERY